MVARSGAPSAASLELAFRLDALAAELAEALVRVGEFDAMLKEVSSAAWTCLDAHASRIAALERQQHGLALVMGSEPDAPDNASVVLMHTAGTKGGAE